LDCENGRFPMGSHVVRDTHPYDHLSFHEVMVRSSNIGMSKVGMRMGAEAVYSGLRRFGFGDTSGLQFTGETRGLLRPTSRWAKIDVATHAFGQGIAVTPLQMARAIAAIANGGSLPALRLQLDAPLQASKRIISERSARAVQEMMYDVVASEHGTGGKAAIPGVRVGGKTGTAQKARVDGRGYEAGAYIASFVGFADASSLGLNQRLVLLVVVDEPRGKSYYGGAVAAPAFQRILQRTLSLLLTRSRLQPRSMPPAGHLLEVGYRPA
jgi:cell division protein FtsI (penicillin-binding protein 3)